MELGYQIIMRAQAEELKDSVGTLLHENAKGENCLRRLLITAALFVLALLVLSPFCLGIVMEAETSSTRKDTWRTGGEDWLSGWTYRKAHSIMGSPAGAQTDYPVQLQVHYGDGVDAGAYVFLNSKCKPDFGDVRFTDSAGAGDLAYWIEKKVNGASASFWVKVEYIPIHPENATIYIYYGNTEASTSSNGDATFTFWDDFEGDLSKWNLGLGYIEPVISTDHPFEGSKGLKIPRTMSVANKNLSVTTSTAIRVRFYDQMTPRTEKFTILARGNTQVACLISVDDELYNGASQYYYRFGQTYYLSSVTRAIGWHLFEITNDGATTQMWIDGEPQGLTGSGVLIQFMIGAAWAANDEYGYFDVAIQRSYCNPEPVNIEWEAEEGRCSVMVSPGFYEIVSGNNFTLRVEIDDVNELYGFDIHLEWDVELLDYISHTVTVPVDGYLGGVLHNPVLPVRDEVNETTGTYWVAYASLLPAPSFNGSGKICEISFLARAEGNCTIDILSSQLSDFDGQPIAHSVVDGVFSIRDIDFHDVAVMAIRLANDVVGQGCVTPVNVTVANLGTYTEGFNVTLLANASTITSTPVMLVNGSSQTITFLWNTSGYSKGNYQVSAEANLLSPERNSTNNYLVNGIVLVTITGDVNGDRDVDIFDIVLISRIYRTAKPDPRYEPRCDFDNDDDVDIFDIVAAVTNYAEQW